MYKSAEAYGVVGSSPPVSGGRLPSGHGQSRRNSSTNSVFHRGSQQYGSTRYQMPPTQQIYHHNHQNHVQMQQQSSQRSVYSTMYSELPPPQPQRRTTYPPVPNSRYLHPAAFSRAPPPLPVSPPRHFPMGHVDQKWYHPEYSRKTSDYYVYAEQHSPHANFHPASKS